MLGVINFCVDSLREVLFTPKRRKQQQQKKSKKQGLTSSKPIHGKRKLGVFLELDNNSNAEEQQEIEAEDFSANAFKQRKRTKLNPSMAMSNNQQQPQLSSYLKVKQTESTQELLNVLKHHSQPLYTGKIEHAHMNKNRRKENRSPMHHHRRHHHLLQSPGINNISLMSNTSMTRLGGAAAPSDLFSPDVTKRRCVQHKNSAYGGHAFKSPNFLSSLKSHDTTIPYFKDSIIQEEYQKEDEEYFRNLFKGGVKTRRRSHTIPPSSTEQFYEEEDDNRLQQQHQQRKLDVKQDNKPVIDEKLARKINSIEVLRERVQLMSLTRDIAKDRYALQIAAELITQITDELSEKIAQEAIKEELPYLLYDKILDEIIDDDIEVQKEFIELTSDDEDALEWTLSWKNTRKVIIDKFKIDMTGEKLKCLGPTEWLNDEVINFYFNMCMDRAAMHPGKYPSCHFFNTFFHAKLTNNGKSYSYSNVRRWTKNIDLFSMDKVIIPVHLGAHWVLAVINIRDKRFEYYDSMLGGTSTAKEVLHTLRRYLEDEHKDKKKEPYDTSDWEEYIATRKEYPQQANSWDCGMFTCKCANYICQDKPIDFSQNNMKYFRKRMIVEIKRGYVL